MKKQWLIKLLYGSFAPEHYAKIEEEIWQKNRATLRLTSFIAAMLLLVLFAAAFCVDTLANNRLLYGVFGCAMVLIGLANEWILKKHKKLVLPVFYLFLLLAYSFGIILGVPLQREIPATTFCVLLFALPLLVIDKPYRMSLLLIAVSVIFCLATDFFKPAAIASLDRTNALCFLFLGMVVNSFVTRTKVSELLSRRYIEKERDTDDLTKLLTKAAASREIGKFMAEKGGNAALLVIDIDDFKQINDKMGHAYGDAVLRIMGECIRTVFRSSDILSRFGGDEFILFLPHADHSQILKRRIEALVEVMTAQLSSSENAMAVTGSIGVAFYPRDGETYEELFQKADEALYRSKGKGKNCYTFYLDSNLLEREEQGC